MSQLPIRIEIPRFIRKVQMSEKQQPKYYEWNGIQIKGKGKKIPMSFYKDKQDIPINTTIEHLKDDYVIGIFKNNVLSGTIRDTEFLPSYQSKDKNKYRLCKITKNTVEAILCNPKVVGTPRWYLIKGQDIYSGNLREHQKGFIMDKIKECFYPYIKDLTPITDYPVIIAVELHDTIKNPYSKNHKDEIGQRWDIDNYVYPYLKAFPDLLTREGILIDDDRLHLTQPPAAIFVPIENHEERKLVFNIFKDERVIIQNNKHYTNFHKKTNGENMGNTI